VRPLSLIGPSAVIGGEPVVARSDSALEGAGRGGCPSSLMSGLPVLAGLPRGVQRVMVVGAAGWATMVNASSPSPVRMCVLCRTIRRACDRQARFAS
jgi:hypothetical protein